jgi:hypothetical protein
VCQLFIQEATTLFSLEDALERRMDAAIVVIQKSYRTYRNKRYFLTVRADAFDLINGRKERRRGSVSARYQGDYISAYSNKLLQSLLSSTGSREKLLFADRAKHVILRGKRSALGQVFGKKQTEFEQIRLVLLSDKALYSCAITQDPATGQSKIDLYFRVPLLQIAHVLTSPYADNYLIIHFAASQGAPTDVLWRIRHKNEFFALLVQESKKLGRGMFDLRFQNSDSIVANAAKKRVVAIQWVKDDMLDQGTEILERGHKDELVTIRVGPGLPASQIPTPPRPSALELSAPGSGRP